MRPSLLSVVILISLTSALHATPLYSTSFEAPQFTVGALESQNGFYYDAAGQVGQVESGISHSGTQAVEFNANGTSGQNVSTVDTPVTPNPGGITTVQIAAMFSGDSTTIFQVLGLDSSAGFLTQLVYRDGIAYFTSSAGTVYLPVALDTWNVYSIQIDYDTQTASGYVNGGLIGTRAFYTPSTDLTSTSFGINSAPGTDTGYFDDLSVSTTPVPEPSSLALLGTGTLALMGAVRRKISSR